MDLANEAGIGKGSPFIRATSTSAHNKDILKPLEPIPVHIQSPGNKSGSIWPTTGSRSFDVHRIPVHDSNLSIIKDLSKDL